MDEDWATWSRPSNVCIGDSDRKHERLVANVSDGGINCLSANANARLDTRKVQKRIRETIKSVLGDDIGEE